MRKRRGREGDGRKEGRVGEYRTKNGEKGNEREMDERRER